MELIIPVDIGDKKPMYEQIYIYIRNQIKNGFFTADTRLPSTRKLAENLKVSRSTTQLAYDQLESEGYIEARPYKGYFVAKMEELISVPVEALHDFIESDMTKNDSYILDFSPRGIDFSVFPYSIWRKLSKDTYIDDNKDMFATGNNMGERSLREAISTYLHQARGVNADADKIIIGSGNEYLMILLGLILGEKRKIAMETPSYKQAYRVFSNINKWDVIAVRMDEQGMTVSDFENLTTDTLYVMPSHQYPTGIVMPVGRRQELFNWASKDSNRYIIEDDYDSEFRYKGKPIPAMQGSDSDDKIIYMGTFSKAIAPAIRVGYMVLPPKLISVYKEKAGYLSCTVPRMDQNILYHFIADGYFERHLNKMRAHYRNKRDIIVEKLKEFGSDYTIRADNAGLHVILKCNNGLTEKELELRAAKVGIKVYPISDFFIHKDHCKDKSTVVLGYASLTVEEIIKGTELLKEVWRLHPERKI